MRDYINSFFAEFGYSESERVDLTLAYERILASDGAKARLSKILTDYDRDTNSVTADTLPELEAIASDSGVSLYTVELVTLICLSRKLRERLAAIGVPKKSIALTLADLIYKMNECEAMYGVVGVTPWDWYTRWLRLRLVAFGRLQFELSEFKGQNYYRKHGKTIKKRAPVLAVHIPSNGSPLLDRACVTAYKEAHGFFTRLLGLDDIAFTCSSWLLYPLNRGILPESSNIVKFMNRYDIIEVYDYEPEQNWAVPFVFLRAPNTLVSELPRDTTLRAGYLEHLECGGRMGYGYGVMFIENENDTV